MDKMQISKKLNQQCNQLLKLAETLKPGQVKKNNELIDSILNLLNSKLATELNHKAENYYSFDHVELATYLEDDFDYFLSVHVSKISQVGHEAAKQFFQRPMKVEQQFQQLKNKHYKYFQYNMHNFTKPDKNDPSLTEEYGGEYTEMIAPQKKNIIKLINTIKADIQPSSIVDTDKHALSERLRQNKRLIKKDQKKSNTFKTLVDFALKDNKEIKEKLNNLEK